MSLFAGERETLGPTIFVADGTAKPIIVQSPTGTALFTVDGSGNVVAAGTTTFTGAQTFTGAATFGSTIGVSGAATFSSTTGTTGLATFSGGATIATGQTLAVTTADKLTIAGVKVPVKEYATWPLTAGMATASDIFVMQDAIQVIRVDLTVSVVGGSGAVVSIRKITDTSAPGAAASSTVKEQFASPTQDLHSISINTVVSPSLSVTSSDLQYAAGNRMSISMGGTLTGLIGQITITYERI